MRHIASNLNVDDFCSGGFIAELPVRSSFFAGKSHEFGARGIKGLSVNKP
jgi:hypothetical protein